MLFQSIAVIAVCTFQWMLWGYTLGFSRTGSSFIGDFSNFALWDITAAPSSGSAVIPDIVLCFYELVFCACTVMIVVGGAFERGRIVPSMVFGFCFATLVYCPVAYWTWNANGWLYNLPSLDFAGGGPVHIASGWAGLAYALVLGKRRSHMKGDKHRPHNVSLVFLGTCFIWFGWFGFNGGSALNGTIRAMQAAWNTNTAAAMGVIGWGTVDYIRYRGKFSLIGVCEGAIAGLVGITPAAGYVSTWCAAAIGIITAVVCSSLKDINKWIGIDDGLEVFKLHAVGGMVGCFLTGIFATASVSSLDGISFAPGGIDGVGAQVGRQFAELGAVSAWSFTVSCVILLILKYIPFMQLRVSEDAEDMGMDLDQFFEEEVGDWSMFDSLDGLHPGSHLETSTFASATITPPNETVKEPKEAGKAVE